MLNDVLGVVYDTISDLFSFTLPIGITFGAVVVGIFGAPLLVKAFKKFF